MNADEERDIEFKKWWAEFLAVNSNTIASLELIKPLMKRAWDGSWIKAWQVGYASGMLDGIQEEANAHDMAHPDF
jgi:hypothetical protein